MQNWKFASHSSWENGNSSLQDFEDDEPRKFQDLETVQSGTNWIETWANNIRGRNNEFLQENEEPCILTHLINFGAIFKNLFWSSLLLLILFLVFMKSPLHLSRLYDIKWYVKGYYIWMILSVIYLSLLRN